MFFNTFKINEDGSKDETCTIASMDGVQWAVIDWADWVEIGKMKGWKMVDYDERIEHTEELNTSDPDVLE